MPLILYYTDISPPARAVRMLADYLGIDLELKETDLGKKDHHTEEFKKMNPQHTVPVLDDNGFILSDSHAILAYLVTQYGGTKAESLYPKDAKQRALVDSKMHFETGYPFQALRVPIRASIFHGQKGPMTEQQRNQLLDVYDFLDKFLTETKFVALDHLTIADISNYSSVSSLNTMIPVDEKKFSNLARWLKEMDSQSFAKVNKPGVEIFGNYVTALFAEI